MTDSPDLLGDLASSLRRPDDRFTGNPFRDNGCTAACANPVSCPVCGRDLPPRGRSVPIETYISECCEEHRYDKENTRHLWSADELED